MRKLTRKNLSELAKTLPVIEKDVQPSFVGGGNGTYKNPYTLCEYQVMGSSFTKGWVEMSPDVVSYVQEDYISFFCGSDYDVISFYGAENYGSDWYLDGASDYLGSSEWLNNFEQANNNITECKPSCVFNCYIYLSNGAVDTCYFNDMTRKILGYVPRDDGGVPTADIPIIGGFVGFKVDLLPSGTAIMSDGKTLDGRKVMMTFNEGVEGLDHTVIVTGHKIENGIKYLKYHDPTRNIDDKASFEQITGLYGVGMFNMDAPIPGAPKKNEFYA